MCALCAWAGCLRAFFGKKVGNRPEGEIRMLTCTPALRVGNHREAVPVSGRGWSCLCGGRTSSLAALALCLAAFQGAGLVVLGVGQGCFFLPLGGPPAFQCPTSSSREAGRESRGIWALILLCYCWLCEFSQNLSDGCSLAPSWEVLGNSWVKEDDVQCELRVLPSYVSVGNPNSFCNANPTCSINVGHMVGMC